MRRLRRWLTWTLAVVVAVPTLALLIVVAALNSDPGRRAAEGTRSSSRCTSQFRLKRLP